MLLFLVVVAVAAFVLYKMFYKSVPPPRFLGKVERRRHAVVIGAGIGGIGAARVLSDYFEKVTLIDRDSIDLDHPTGRSGVPQGQQLHGLQAKGATIAEILFPGIIEEWLSHGAAQLDVLRDTLINWQGNCLPHSERMKEGPSIYGIAMSRPFNEFHLRRRLLADRRNVELLTKTTVLGLLHEKEEDGTVRVKGVTIKRPPSPPLRSPRKREAEEEGGEGGGEQQKDQNEFLLSPRSRAVIEDMDADFVVCSTGRKNRMIKWLKDMKVIGEEDPVPSDTCDPGIGYVSARFKIPEGWREKHTEDFADAMGSLGSPLSVPFAMGAIRLEGGLVHLLATTYGNNPPPNTTEEIMKFFEPAFSGLPGGDVFKEMFTQFEQVSGWEVFHDQKNVFNHFEKLGTRWPQNFVALGDTVATFTPTYAQGMTNALMHAFALKDVFHKHLYDYPVHDLHGLSLKFQKQAAAISKNFWVAVEPSDLQWPTTVGTRTWFKEFQGVFQFYLFREACKSRDKMLKVQMLSNGVAGPALVMLDAELILPALYHTALDFWEKWQKEKNAGKTK